MSGINKREKNENMFRVKWYRKTITDMVEQIDNEKYLKMIYGFVKRLHKE